MSDGARPIRAVFGVIVLLILFMLVNSYWGEYRGVREDGESAEEITATPEPSAEETPAAEGQPEETDETAGGTVVVLIDALNFRKEPSRDGGLIRGLGRNDRLTHLGTKDGWHHVRDENGVEGYVSASPQYTELQE